MQSQNQDNDNGRSAPFVRRATQQTSLSELWSQNISIHPLREEGDATGLRISDVLELHFYPRPPRGGRPAPSYLDLIVLYYFYPRPPRGGQRTGLKLHTKSNKISIHALREEGDTQGSETVLDLARISIHALREEGDGKSGFSRVGVTHFYPRPPRGGRLRTTKAEKNRIYISIHALREEGDERR